MKKREGTYRHAGPPRERMPECPQQYEVTIFGTQAVRKQQTAVDLIDKLPQDGRRKKNIATVTEDIWCSSGRNLFWPASHRTASSPQVIRLSVMMYMPHGPRQSIDRDTAREVIVVLATSI